MTNKPHNPEVKKSAVSESVKSLIDKKKSEKEQVAVSRASEKMSDTQGEVADVLGGPEKPSEVISERKGESGEQGDISASSVTDDDDDQAVAIRSDLSAYRFPKQDVMVKKIRGAIQAQIKMEWRKAKKYRKSLSSGGADGYNDAISRIRQLKELMSSLFLNTVDKLKQMYVKYFTPDGKRRKGA